MLLSSGSRRSSGCYATATTELRRLIMGAAIALATLHAPAIAEPLSKGGGYFKLGPTYQIMGQSYTPQDTFDLDVVGTASWYGIEVHSRKTANGEIFDMNGLTAAHKTLPLPSYVYVTNLENGRRMLVRVNDRGPFIGDRMIDVSDRVAKHLGFFDRGLAKVRVEYAGPAPLNGDDGRERDILAEQLANNWRDGPAQLPQSASVLVATLEVSRTAQTGTATATDRKMVTSSETAQTKAQPTLVSLVKQSPSVETTKMRRPEEKSAREKPLRLARASSAQSTDASSGLSYRPFDPCWSCLTRDQ
jgi:rare lipoprotein A (peptidoglycan hydrolase)